MKYLVIPRGLPGSGKSTWAYRLTYKYYCGNYNSHTSICSADDYFLRPDGRYSFNPKELGWAHSWCQDCAKILMFSKRPLVIIDNININDRDIKVYLNLADKYGYTVKERIIGRFDHKAVKEYAARNVHNCPEGVIQRMADTWNRKYT